MDRLRWAAALVADSRARRERWKEVAEDEVVVEVQGDRSGAWLADERAGRRAEGEDWKRVLGSAG